MTHSSSNNNKVREEALPSGCAPDAIKLFVGNIPRNYNETQLLPLFEAFGPVIDLGIVRDKATLVSKGSAFLWFRERVHAEQAMAQLNLRCVLPDRDPGCPRGGRPLEVRRARPRQQPQQPSVKDAGPRQPSSPSHLGPAGSIHGKAAGQARLEPSRGLKWEVLMPNSQESNSDAGSAASWHHSTRHSDPGPCGFPSGDLDADCISEQLPTLSLSDSFAMSPPSGDIIADVVRMMVPPVQSQYPRSQLLTSLGKALRDAKRDAQQSAWLHDVVSVGDGPVPGQFGPGPAMPPMRPPLGVGGPVMTPDEGLVVESYAVDHSAPLFPVAVANLHSMQTLSGAAVVMSPGANSTSVLFNVMGTREQVQAALWMLVVLLNVKSGAGNEDGNVVKVPV